MKKLKLSLDQLKVDTFRLDDPQPAFGTIRGAESAPEEAIAITAPSWLCGSCNGTCGANYTCLRSCGGENATSCDSPYCWQHPTTDTAGAGAGVGAGLTVTAGGA